MSEFLNAENKQVFWSWKSLKNRLFHFLQTDEKQIRSAIVKSFLENRIDSIIITDKENRILTFNQAAEITFGYQSQEVLGKDITFLMQVPYENTDQVTSWRKEALGGKKDGEIFPIDVSITKIVVGKMIFFVRIIRDLSEKKETEKIWTAHILMQADLKAKNDFLSTVSHEIRTPIHAIMNYTECLIQGLDGPLLEAQKTSLENVYTASKHLVDLVNGLLQFAKMTPDEYKLTVELCPLVNLMQSSIEIISFLAKQKHLEIHTDFPKEEIFLDANRKNLQEIFFNLLSNAIKFSKEGAITVTLKTFPEKIMVSVTDTGCGISEENLPKIFIPFWSAPGRETQKEHTGLGLSITKHLVELQGGTIEVVSKKDIGSTFTVYFPIVSKDL